MSLSHHAFIAKACPTSILIHVFLHVLTKQRWLIMFAIHASSAKFGMAQSASAVVLEEVHGIKILRNVFVQLFPIGMAFHASFAPSAKYGYLVL